MFSRHSQPCLSFQIIIVGFVFITGKNIVCYTVEPVHNDHPRDFRNWPLNMGSLKILTGHGQMPISIAWHTILHSSKQ